jgi:hypothetical protein
VQKYLGEMKSLWPLYMLSHSSAISVIPMFWDKIFIC